MALPNWTTNETVTDTNFNEMVNAVPSSMPLVATPKDSEFKGYSGHADREVARLRLRPVQGRYLHIRHEVKSVDGNAAVGRYALEHSSGEVDLFSFSGITSTTYARARDTSDMEGLTINGETVDVTGDEADLVLYLNDKAVVKLVQIYTGDGSADTDYGAA